MSEAATPTRAPARRPCGSCPYRRDVPAGIWSEEEYLKLPAYDAYPMIEQPMAPFYCHQRDGRLCAGWIACHGTRTLAIRLHSHFLSEKEIEAVANYETDVPVFKTGTEACAHGLSGVANPDLAARRMIDKLTRVRESEGTT